MTTVNRQSDLFVTNPVPASRGGGFQALGYVAEAATSALGGALGIPGLGALDSFAKNMVLLKQQQAIQERAQTFQMHSNILKAEHDSRMAAVQNMRP